VSWRTARDAIEAADDDPLTLCMAGMALAFFGLDHEGALMALMRALELHPNYATALCWIGWVQTLMGDHGAAVECCHRAMRISPRDQERYLFLGVLALAHLGAGRHAEAEAAARRSVQEHPKSIPAHRTLAVALVRLNRIDEARAAVARLLEINPSARISNMLNPIRNRAFVEEFRAALRLAGLPE
jgi:adenylate cyclase